MMRNIKITGFNLADWMKTKSTLSKYFIVRKIGKMIKTNLKTEVDKIFPLSEIHEAIE